MNREESFREIKVGDDWTIPNPNGVGRRTLVQGAVWTVPVIAAATATPAAAASLGPTLTFTNGPYSSSGCEPLGAVTLRLTTDRTTPDPNKPVIVNLPDGLTWTDGTTGPKSFTTDASGVATIPDGAITAPATGGTYPIAAQDSTGTVTASAPVTTSSASDLVTAVGGGARPALPGGATVVDLQSTTVNGVNRALVLASDGNAYYSDQNNGAWVLIGAATHIALNETSDVSGLISDGGVVTAIGGGSRPALPGGATVTELQSTTVNGLNRALVLASDGNAYYSDNNGAWVLIGAATHIALNETSDTGALISNGGVVTAVGGGSRAALPGGATVVDLQSTTVNGVNRALVLASDGNAYYSDQNSGAWVSVGKATDIALNKTSDTGGLFVAPAC